MIRWCLVLLLASFGGTAQARTPVDAEIEYRIRSGDTLYHLAARGFRRQEDYRVVEARNRIRDPRKLRIGTVLRIPSRILRVEPISARIVAFRGNVAVAGSRARAEARLGLPVGPGADILTQANSFATIELADGSRLTVPSDSSLRIVDLHRIVLDGSLVKRFRLSEGRAETRAAPLQKAGDKFEVLTPISVAAVRGTRFRVSYAGAAGTGAASVIEGNVAVSGGGSALVLEAGHGVAIRAEGMGAAAPLLNAPALQRPDRLQDGRLVDFAILPLSGAHSYRAQLATDAGFVDIFAESEATAQHMTFADVPNGSFFVRLTGLSAGGVEGMPAVYTFERRRNDITASVEDAEVCPRPRCLRFRWQVEGEGEARFRFQIAPGRDATPIVDQDDMTAREIVMTDLAPGTYYWRVESTRTDGDRRISRWTDHQELRVTPLKR